MSSENIYYVYAYLRKKDSKYAKAGEPYYIGKGKNKRAFAKHRVKVPKNKNLIVFLETNLTNIGACALERRMIRWYGKVTNGGILLNMTYGGDGGNGYYGCFPAKDSLTGKFVGHITKSDPRYISGELISNNNAKKNVSVAKNLNGESLGAISLDDPRWHTGEIVHIKKGIIQGTVSSCDINGISIGSISIDDPRFITGEIRKVGPKKGKMGAIVVATGEKLGRVDLSDSRWKTGEILSVTSGYVCVKDYLGKNNKKVSIQDKDYKSGKLLHQSLKRCKALTKEGVEILVSVGDDRFITGEILFLPTPRI